MEYSSSSIRYAAGMRAGSINLAPQLTKLVERDASLTARVWLPPVAGADESELRRSGKEKLLARHVADKTCNFAMANVPTP